MLGTITLKFSVYTGGQLFVTVTDITNYACDLLFVHHENVTYFTSFPNSKLEHKSNT
jgi:hypothetical protein